MTMNFLHFMLSHFVKKFNLVLKEKTINWKSLK